MALNLIYHFQASQNMDEDFTPASYRVIYFFSESGFVGSEMLIELSKAVPEARHSELSFLSLDDLKAFALRICIELSYPEVRLISVQDYNIGLDSARDDKTYQAIFERFGEVIVNESLKKKGLLSKIFGP